MSDSQNNAENTDSPRVPLEQNSTGDICINENVIAALVRRATLAVPGVSRLSGNQLFDSLTQMVGSNLGKNRAIAITFNDDDSVSIEVKIHVKFDVQIHEVAAQIQRDVKNSVEKATNIRVTRVNVLISAIDEDSPEPAEKA